jgi:erythromycin esterase-like protein
MAGLARVVLLGLALGTCAYAQSSVPTDWIRSHAIPFTTTEAGHGFDDLQPLKPIIGSARIVSLGEATHGSREFFQVKHRLLEFMATEMGFSVFAIEANMPEAYRLNDYVLTGAGDPAALLRGMYVWAWDTEEVLDMIRWMREFNRSGRGRLQFTGFDMQFPNVAAELVRDFVSRYEPTYAEAIRDATAMATSPTSEAADTAGVATAHFPVAVAAGKRVRLSGYIKTEGMTRGFAGLWWRVDGPSGVLAFDNMRNRGATGSSDWKRFELELPVDSTVRNINFGVLMPGDGTAWFDDLSIELDGKPFDASAQFDLGFEAPFPRGFVVGGNGYSVVIDQSVAHSGKQSLRITALSSTPGSGGPDAKAVAARWQEVRNHLDGERALYAAVGAKDAEITWAIQNSRIVMQAMQLRARQVDRDRIMAENIKWIADQNPGAKIVVWAHNGHVAAGGMRAPMMGSFLRTEFGPDLRVFGFAFNQGGFQAFSPGENIVKRFTVPPARPDTLDASLAASGLPLFALDLRNAPAWFSESHSTRLIGAAYPDGDPYAFTVELAAAKAFDVLLFVDTTTPARNNPGR